MKKLLCCFLLLCIPLSTSWAEDIELYVGDNVQRAGERPQVLIIFDTSGSMSRDEVINTEYDPNTDYGTNEFTYYSTDGSVPTVNSSARFLTSENGCNSSLTVIDTNGFYNGKVSYYKPNRRASRAGRWRSLSGSPSLASGNYIDCEEDVTNLILTNGVGIVDGLPSNDNTDLKNPPPYSLDPDATPSFGSGATLYSSNYIQWYNNAGDITKSRLEIAKETVTDLIQSAPGVSFGLQVFNQNNSSSTNGGRIAYAIKDVDNYNSETLIDLIDDEITANGNTPLCESLYEAALYFGGANVRYGNSGGSKTPLKGDDVSTNGVYNSPYAGCSNEIFVILITDGEPTQDTSADGYVDALINNGSGNRLDELASWMHNNDINENIDGDQIATIFTIGFGDDAVISAGDLLNETATRGGGKYYPATEPGDLLISLQSALLEILKVSTSFTSPSIASNNFDRTETLDSVYYAMFLPERGPRWNGNLKKLKISGDKQLDRTDAVAINEAGNITNNAKTFWSDSNQADGPEVKKGGVAEMLREKTNRKLYSDLGTNGALAEFNLENATDSFGDEAALASYMNVEVELVQSQIDWASGIDVDDENDDGDETDIRLDVFGDPLHSKPLVVNYGGSRDNQDVRIIVGTNAGFVHMFDDAGNTVDESWAFIPKELFDNISILRENSSTEAKVYGIDGTPTVHLMDTNGDGSIKASDGDKAWLYFGLRRGGSSYYALDISSPDTPTLLWKIDSSTEGFAELGQSWGKIKIGYSKANIDNGVPKPVAFISGGYDPSKDASGVGASDADGKAIYIVDAEAGTLIWSATPAATAGVNLKWTGIEDSIPSSLAIMDSDSDGLIDRIYTGDTGGNLWRVDMPGSSPFSVTTPWTIHHLAELGGNTDISDRRFFNEPTIARAIITDTISTTIEVEGGTPVVTISRNERKYDAVLLGSGDRTRPTSTVVADKFFMIKDPDIITRSFGMGNHIIPETIDDIDADLFDFTSNPYGADLSTQAKETLDISVSSRSGWFIDYTESGEKSVSAATAIAGVAYFNSFSPGDTPEEGVQQCRLSAGVGRLYAVDLAQGSNVYDWRTFEVGDKVPDTPTIIIPPEAPTEDTNDDGVIDENDQATTGKIRLVGVGSGLDENGDKGTGTLTLCDAADCDTTEGIRLETMRTHLYVEEDN